ncbi:MAG: hypothetical protein ACQEP7_00750, partial [bacterium]
LSFNWSDRHTELPPDRPERVRNDDLGTVDNKNLGFNTGLGTPGRYPDFNFNWSRQDKEVYQMRRERQWTDENKNWKLGSNYSQNFKEPIFNFIPVGHRLSVSADGSYRRKWVEKESFGEVDVSEEDREEGKRDFSVDFGVHPWSWISLHPSLNFSDLNRETLDESGLVKRKRGGSLQVQPDGFWGLDPSADFNLDLQENFQSGEGTKNVSISGNSNFSFKTTPRRWWSGLEFLTMRYSFNIDNSGKYDDLGKESVRRVYDDFFEDLSWIVDGADLEVASDELSIFRSSASKKLSHSLRGNLDLWDPLSTRYNISFNENLTQSDGSVEKTKSQSYSLNNSLALTKVSNWFKSHAENSSLEVKYSLSRSRTDRKQSQNHKLRTGWNTGWGPRWNTNVNFNADYELEEDRAVTRKKYAFAPALDFSWLVNKPDEGGILWFDKRLELNGGISADFNKQTEDGQTEEDNYSYSGNLGTGYNVSEQIKTSFSGSFKVYRDNYREANDRNEYSIQGSVDFRF